jgi:hypothetical protein
LARVAFTVEEVMELVTCQYIDFPGVEEDVQRADDHGDDLVGLEGTTRV